MKPSKPNYATLDGRPNRCWNCGGELQIVTRGPHRGKISFRIVRDQLGYDHPVHMCCEADSLREVRQLTAIEGGK